MSKIDQYSRRRSTASDTADDKGEIEMPQADDSR